MQPAQCVYMASPSCFPARRCIPRALFSAQELTENCVAFGSSSAHYLCVESTPLLLEIAQYLDAAAFCCMHADAVDLARTTALVQEANSLQVTTPRSFCACSSVRWALLCYQELTDS
eukprot:16610-Heterococcus_DN1.PRE.9